MKLLLHICCAPCLIYPFEVLKNEGSEICGLFYNPNIHPLAEYDKRRQEVERLSNEIGLEVFYPEYEPSEFFRAVNMSEDKGQRCPICWRGRLDFTARLARGKGFTHFSSTLLVSPYQDQELLKKIGNDIAAERGMDFYFEDFRPGFRKAHDEAKSKGIYCQKYCGCIYSEIDRCRKSQRP